ncbi:unnamed protein product [Haemonchus placei]|uniref:Ovule protein n=1 Tax=Haemonchus placei TaxID=6290 RepID=A0A0N4X126_HAEPC|nr:unnamed protein product [Haemonchus placei]
MGILLVLTSSECLLTVPSAKYHHQFLWFPRLTLSADLTSPDYLHKKQNIKNEQFKNILPSVME